MNFTRSYHLLFIYSLVLGAFFLKPDQSFAQARMTINAIKSGKNVGGKLEKIASKQLRKEVGKKKSTARNEMRTRAKLKNLPAGGGGPEEEYYDPTMGELIEDPNARYEIENTNNKTRFINLFGQWWSTPSQLDVKAEFDYAKIRDSILNIDSSEFRVPKLVNDYQFVTIFGWHPHFNGNAYKSYNYKLLTAIAYYSYDIDPFTGGYQDSDSLVIHQFLGGDDPDNGIVPTAHANDCKVLLTVSSHSFDNNAVFLEPDNRVARQNLIDNVISLLDTSKADGIELNFENVPAAYRYEFYKFVKQISYSIRKRADTLSVCMSVPAYDPEMIFDLSMLDNDIDFFIIKAFNYHDDPSDLGGLTKRPGAPLNYTEGSGEEDIRSTVKRYIASTVGGDASRLILALPNYGTLWETTEDGTALLDYVPYYEVKYDYVMRDSAYMLDSNYYSFVWQNIDTLWVDTFKLDYTNIVQRDLFFDDVATLKVKYKFIMDMGLGGVGVWPLGYDVGFDDVWKTLESEFTTFDRPDIPGMEQVNNVTKRARSYSTLMLTVLLFWAIFAAAGFCMALFNLEARRKLFQSGLFRMLFLGFFSLLILLIGAFFGLFVGKTATLMMGVIVGAFFSYGIIVILTKRKAKSP